MAFYGTVEDVKDLTGVRFADLYLHDEHELDAKLEGWLEIATSMINYHQGIDYFEEFETIPPAIDSIAIRMTANLVTEAKLRREANVIRLGEHSERPIYSMVMTQDIIRDLKDLPSNRRVFSFTEGGFEYRG